MARQSPAAKTRGAVLARGEPARGVELRDGRKGRVRRLIAHGHKEPVHRYAPALKRRLVLDHDAGELALALKGHDAAVHEACDVPAREHGADVRRLGAELVTAVYYVNLRADIGEEQRVLKGGVAAAGDGDGAVLVEGAVADCAVADAVAGELVFAVYAEFAVLGAGGEDYGLGGVVAVGGGDGEAAGGGGDGGDFGELGVGAEAEGLGEHAVGELSAGDLGDAGEVVDLGRPGDLTAEAVFLEHEHGLFRAPGVDGRGEPRRPTADNDDVVRCKHKYLSQNSF